MDVEGPKTILHFALVDDIIGHLEGYYGRQSVC